MATPTYDLIASNVLSSSASSVTFSSIPATYRDLVLVAEIKSPGTLDGGTAALVAFNSNTTGYSWVRMYGDGSSAGSDTGTDRLISYNGYDNKSSLTIVQIMDYSATDKHKTWLARYNSVNTYAQAQAGRWANTAAIDSVAFSIATNFPSGSTFYLYGIVS